MSEHADYVIIGAGVTGLAFANAIRTEAASRGKPAPSVVILEGEDEPGGYCRTIVRDGFVWDFSGHFFHFRRPEVEQWLRDRMPDADLRTVLKRSIIRIGDTDVDFPFQKNIHQLPKADFIDCLTSLYFREEDRAGETGDTFESMLYDRYGRGIAERFLIPYNEKLYACSMSELDKDAMGRFFPHASMDEIIRNMREPDNASYNASFTYPLGGAIEYIRALCRDLPDGVIRCGEWVTAIDVDDKSVAVGDKTLSYGQLVSSVPLPKLAAMVGAPVPKALTWNKVAVWNLGFDRKGEEGVHWMYFPERHLPFYRVGFYDNIMGGERMSLYVEVGATADENIDLVAKREAVLQGLRDARIITDQKLIAEHSIVLDPAYVHISRAGQAAADGLRADLRKQQIHSAGRYGRWTYCSIEDNIVEARELAAELA